MKKAALDYEIENYISGRRRCMPGRILRHNEMSGADGAWNF